MPLVFATHRLTKHPKGWVLREFIQEHPDWLFVFGDNLSEVGYGGQAHEYRGEPNAIGIATMTYRAGPFSEEDFDLFVEKMEPVFEYLQHSLERGVTVVWPGDHIGTGIARLSEVAPSIDFEIGCRLSEWIQHYLKFSIPLAIKRKMDDLGIEI